MCKQYKPSVNLKYFALAHLSEYTKGNNKITELRTTLQREIQNS
jgi:hypothetical protein